jgi:hypothetical protein
MGKYLHDDQHYSQRLYVGSFNERKRYNFFSFIFDCTMTLATCGLWLIRIFVREMRKR